MASYTKMEEDWTPLKQLYLLNKVCRMCGRKGSPECSRCRVEEMRQELYELHGEEFEEYGE